MASALRQRQSVPRFNLWVAALAVFYLTIGVHLLHPLFHQKHDNSYNYATSYHNAEHHHHAPCPLHDYCLTIHHLNIADDVYTIRLLMPTERCNARFKQRVPHQYHLASTPARAPPVV
ncbi:MAG: hypothetical protein RBR22_12500 [Desulfuromonas sp.]|nr:hypothetical protein [Desulfuromonas sp.]